MREALKEWMDLQHRLLLKTILFSALLIVVWYNSHIGLKAQAQDGQIAHAALCAFTEDLQKRHDDAVDYLLKHPKGAPSIGVTRKQVLDSIHTQEHVLAAIRSAGLEC